MTPKIDSPSKWVRSNSLKTDYEHINAGSGYKAFKFGSYQGNDRRPFFNIEMGGPEDAAVCITVSGGQMDGISTGA